MARMPLWLCWDQWFHSSAVSALSWPGSWRIRSVSKAHTLIHVRLCVNLMSPIHTQGCRRKPDDPEEALNEHLNRIQDLSGTIPHVCFYMIPSACLAKVRSADGNSSRCATSCKKHACCVRSSQSWEITRLGWAGGGRGGVQGKGLHEQRVKCLNEAGIKTHRQYSTCENKWDMPEIHVWKQKTRVTRSDVKQREITRNNTQHGKKLQ